MIRDLIVGLKQQGVTIFLCSHLLEQVQEICDHVGIIFKGKLVKEGRLDDLIAIEDQTEVIIQNATPEELESIRQIIDSTSHSKIVRIGKPRTTLERLFLDEAKRSEANSQKGAPHA